MAVNYTALVEGYQKAPGEATSLLQEALRDKYVNPRDFDFGRLFEECFGWEEFRACRRDKKRLVTTDVFEAAGAVSTSAFRDISDQILYRLILDAYENEDFVFTKKIPEYQSEFTFEKIPGVTRMGFGNDDEWVTDEGEPFQIVGVGQDYIHYPETVKRGKIVPVTREALFFDRTGLVQERCKEVGYWLGFNRETRAIDCAIDENKGARSAADGGHRYHWRGTPYATYGDLNATTHPWDNLAASNPLVDWTSINAAEQLLNEMVDPATGAPIVFGAEDLVVTKQLEKTAMRIVNATEIHVVTPGYALSNNPTLHDQRNPYMNAFNIVSSRLLAQRLALDTSWFLGSISKSFVYVVNFPMQTLTAPANSDDEFKRDIVLQTRADERGAYGTKQPRGMVRNNS